MGRRAIQKVRHWRQRFDPDVDFIWRRSILFDGRMTKVGAPVPKSLRGNRRKLRDLWEAKTIELARFGPQQTSTERALARLPEGHTHVSSRSNWHVVRAPDGTEHRLLGAKGVDAYVDALVEAGDTTSGGDTSDGDSGDG